MALLSRFPITVSQETLGLLAVYVFRIFRICSLTHKIIMIIFRYRYNVQNSNVTVLMSSNTTNNFQFMLFSYTVVPSSHIL